MEEKIKVNIKDDAFVYGDGGKRITGEQILDKKDADELVSDGKADYVEEKEEVEEIIPDETWTVVKIKEWLTNNKIDFDEKAKKNELLGLIKEQ